MRLTRSIRTAVITATVVTAWPAPSGGSPFSGRVSACPPKEISKVFARNRYGTVYRMAGDGQGIRSCSKSGAAVWDPEESIDFKVQPQSVGLGGRNYAFAVAVCDTDNPCITNIAGRTLGGRRAGRNFSMYASDDAAGFSVFVTRMRVSANRALVWIACAGGPGPPVTARCLRDGRRRWIYAQPAGPIPKDLLPKRIATGLHIDPRYLKISSTGKSVFWKQSGKTRRARIDR